MITQTKETQAALNPNTAWELLKEGNKRFVEQKPLLFYITFRDRFSKTVFAPHFRNILSFLCI